MFLYEKKIVYLSFFREGVKGSSAGFVRISRERDVCRLDIHIKRIVDLPEGEYSLSLVLKSRELQWGNVVLRGGGGRAEKSLPVCREKIRLGEKEFNESELCGILIRLDETRWVSGYWQEPDRIRALERTGEPTERYGEEKDEAVSASHCAEKKDEAVFTVHRTEKKGDLYAADEYPPKPVWGNERREPVRYAPGGKWEQLQGCYKSIHPFGDERMYLSIEPKDFVILRAPYQRLVNNSFLLHGFYNYRHLILGPDEEMGTDGETCDRSACFYLGVPGTYFEREKMVAVMFGFEGFECNGPVEVGKFGYYMRRVEL